MPVITVTAEVKPLAGLFNYLIQVESSDSPCNAMHHRSLLRYVREWLEAHLIADAPAEFDTADGGDDPGTCTSDLDSNASTYIEDAVDDLIRQLGGLLDYSEIIAVAPADVHGLTVVVLTRK